MRKKRTLGLYLTGGLGNQLFQIAAAISIAGDREIEVLEKPGRPRLNSNMDPELFGLSVSKLANINRKKEDSFLLQKSTGYVLRSSIYPSKIEQNRFFALATNLAATIIQSMQIRKPYYPVASSEVGYSELIRRSSIEKVFNPFLIGYFQSFVWPESIQGQLRSLTINSVGPDLRLLRIEAEAMAPVVIHIRRGDYKLETAFGLPGEKYYKSGMEIIDRSHSHHPIWVFSDDVNEAREILSWLPPERVKYISDVDGQSAASLMAMRLGSAYVIANSTFSWWGAFLSDTQDPVVVVPDPWFIGQKEPNLLIPKDWIRIQY